MKLKPEYTKEERIIIYKEMLENIKDLRSAGFCGAFGDVVGDSNITESKIMPRLPELQAEKPNETYDNDYWFPVTSGRNQRIEILEKIIKELTN